MYKKFIQLLDKEKMEGKKIEKKMNQDSGTKTFSVPYSLEDFKETLVINTINTSNYSKEIIINQAFKFHSQGNISEAIKCYKNFIDKGFEDSRVFSNYGTILQKYGKLKEAQELQLKAIELNPNLFESYLNLGSILKDLGELNEAEVSTRKAIELKPDSAIAYKNLGMILYRLARTNEAEKFTRKAIELNPNYAVAYFNLANILHDLDRLNEAEKAIRKSIEIEPNDADSYSNLGSILTNLGSLNEAESSVNKSIKINPLDPDYYYNLSLIQLLKGDYKSGLENYEYRYQKKEPTINQRSIKIKRIDYKNLKKGEKILVISEQGLGDALQFMRYIPCLINKGFDVSFSVSKKLHPLVKSSKIISDPITPQQALTLSEGKWMSLLSLPKYLKVNPSNPIITDPYIFSTDELDKKWKNILSKEKRPIVGINWQGNPSVEKYLQNGRSLSLESFSVIAKENKIKFMSLQKGYGSEQIESCSFRDKFVSSQKEVDRTWDFLETTSLIANCDLIITSDTSVAHLAGGMGKLTWLLLKEVPEWRWGTNGDKTFWYPSMRLFRQRERHNWIEVMKRVSKALKKEMLV